GLAFTAAPRLHSTLHLIDFAQLRLLIRPPAQKLRSMPKPSASEMIVLDLTDQFRRQRLPFGGAFGGPSARATRRVARKARRLDQLFELLCQRRLLMRFETRAEAHVMQ